VVRVDTSQGGATASGSTVSPTWSQTALMYARSGLNSLTLLLTSPTAILLQPFSLLKGLNEGFLADFLNADLTGPYLGSDKVGYLSALGLLGAALTASCSGWVSVRCGRAYMMAIGMLSFGLPALLNTVRNAIGGQLSIFFLIACYVGYGGGRGVFDSTNRAVCASLFAEEFHPQIFALTRLGEGLGALFAFSVCPCADGAPLQQVIVVTSVGSLACYLASEYLAKSQPKAM